MCAHTVGAHGGFTHTQTLAAPAQWGHSQSERTLSGRAPKLNATLLPPLHQLIRLDRSPPLLF